MNSIHESLLQHYPSLCSKINNVSNQEWIEVSRSGKTPFESDPFRVILLRHTNSSKPILVATLIAFNDRRIKSEVIAKVEHSRILNNLKCDSISLCEGLDDDFDVGRLDLRSVLIDQFADKFFIRSRSCEYAVFYGSESRSSSCHNCHNHSSQLSSNQTKIETASKQLTINGKLSTITELRQDLELCKVRPYHDSIDGREQLDKVIRVGSISLMSSSYPLTNVERSKPVRIKVKKKCQPKDKQTPALVSPSAKPKLVMKQCQVCLFKHNKPHIFERHCQTHLQRYDLNAPVTCPLCRETFKTKQELNPHFQAVHDKTKGCCVECLEIMEWQSLKKHLTYVHYILPKNKLCPHCGEAFKNKQDLEVHISVQHDHTAQSAVCDHCGRQFPHAKILSKHIQTVHVYNNKGVFKCPFCDKVFDRSHAWHKHIKIHSKNKPYKCGWCDYKAVNRFNVRLHMRKRHREDASYDDLIKEGNFDFGTEHKIDMEAYKVE